MARAEGGVPIDFHTSPFSTVFADSRPAGRQTRVETRTGEDDPGRFQGRKQEPFETKKKRLVKRKRRKKGKNEESPRWWRRMWMLLAVMQDWWSGKQQMSATFDSREKDKKKRNKKRWTMAHLLDMFGSVVAPKDREKQ